MTTYSYTKTPVAVDRLTQEIQQSSIVTALDHINLFGVALDINFRADLSDTDKTTLDDLVSAHAGAPLVQNVVQPVYLQDGSGNTINQIDTDNAQIVRIKAAKKGWTYTATAFEFITAQIGSMIALNVDASSKSWVTLKIYDAAGVEITDPALQSNAVRTHVDFEPPYDYEVIGGEMRITPALSTDMRLFIIAVPDVPYAYGGSRVMAENLNLRFLLPGNMFQVDGRVSKFLQASSTNHTNKLRLVFWHAAGVQENLMVTIEHFRQ
jgi:hypothetical protein